MLEIRKLRGGYGGTEVLRGVSMDLAAGEIVALLGSNGAGKSTFNNTVCGLQRPFSGSVRFETREIGGAASAEIVALGLIQVPEGRRIFPNLSVRENLELGSYRRARERRPANLERVLGIFPRLGERTGQKAGTLSGGEQQMLAIGRALMAEPRLLILDEPSLGLSPRLVEELFALISRLNRDGLSILLVEQNVGQSLEIAHRAYVMENGAIAFEGTPAELLMNAELTRAYLGI
ncbi:MAG TPA: ABC transporter ATP-binding protein [Burkholderiales bacterium]|nr:ABC transporter ATP-binding protein [Burkholderiales bacterium]